MPGYRLGWLSSCDFYFFCSVDAFFFFFFDTYYLSNKKETCHYARAARLCYVMNEAWSISRKVFISSICTYR